MFFSLFITVVGPRITLLAHAGQIEAGLPASSPEVSGYEDDTTMGTGTNDTAPATVSPVHVDFTMEQAQAHYNAVVGILD